MPLAFPTAEGFGRNAIGGRGGAVYEVTHLLDAFSGQPNYVGSFRRACEASGPRNVVFRVSGTIVLLANIAIVNPYITIAGQTTPGQGIQCRGYAVHILTYEVIMRFIRVRVGADNLNLSGPTTGMDTNAILTFGTNGVECYNIMVDHCVAQWSTDQNFDIYARVNRITYQWCMSVEGMRFGASDNINIQHSAGGIYGCEPCTIPEMTMSVHHCLYAHNIQRNILVNPYSWYAGEHKTMMDFRNNVVYNWSANGGSCAFTTAYYALADRNAAVGAGHVGNRVNFINNYYLPGPSTNYPADPTIGYVGPCTKVYARGTVCPLSQFEPVDGLYAAGFNAAEQSFDGLDHNEYWPNVPSLSARETQIEHPVDPVATFTADEAFTQVLLEAGASRVFRNGVRVNIRDSVEQRIINSVNARTGATGFGITLSDYQAGARFDFATIAPATPPVDSDHDGIPDSWALAHGLNPNGNPGPQLAADGSGYTNLENYINELAGDLVVSNPDVTPPAVPTNVVVV